jgi:hypothetical protein
MPLVNNNNNQHGAARPLTGKERRALKRKGIDPTLEFASIRGAIDNIMHSTQVPILWELSAGEKKNGWPVIRLSNFAGYKTLKFGHPVYIKDDRVRNRQVGNTLVLVSPEGVDIMTLRKV